MVLGDDSMQGKNIRGFTLIELLVSIAIMSIILGITLSGGPQAIMRLTLSDNAYQTELLVREAQLQGSAINSFNNVYGGTGIFFNRASTSQVLKFKDIIDPSIQKAIGVGNGLYDASLSTGTPPSVEFQSMFKFTNNHHIGKLCVATSTSPVMCNDEYTPHIDTLTISFSRPKQTAHIFANGTTTTDYTYACIQVDSLRSPALGYVQSILIYRSGIVTKILGVCH